jgi:hypothetical protein
MHDALGLLLFWCAVPYLLAIVSSGEMPRSWTAIGLVHLGSIALAAAAVLCVPDGSLRRAMLTAAALVILQYWVIVRMVRDFERRQGRDPDVVASTSGPWFRRADWRIWTIWWFLLFACLAVTSLMLKLT